MPCHQRAVEQSPHHKEDGVRVVADNRRARYDYEIIDTYEAGIDLKVRK